MAYMSQERKQKLATALKTILKGSGLKYSLSVHNYSTLVIKIKSGPVDFIQNYIDTVSKKSQYHSSFAAPEGYMDVNDFHYKDQFTGKALDLMTKIITTLNEGNHDNSDAQSDYFDVGWYLNVKIGQFNKPYQVNK